jgi:hypothetical protein
MPYIDQKDREILEKNIRGARTAGELNYKISRLVDEYLTENERGVCYQSFNDIIGALEGAKLEIYRRLVIGYEDQKILGNGDVYTKETIRKCNG